MVFLESVLLAVCCSLDAFSLSFSYGAEGVRIPMPSCQIINAVSCAVLGLSLCAGALVGPYLPARLTVGIAFGVLFVLGVWKFFDRGGADVNGDKVISPSEAAALAVSLSLDGLAVGFGAGLARISVPAVLVASLAANTLAVTLGNFLGNNAARRLPFRASRLGGVILIALAVSKLF